MKKYFLDGDQKEIARRLICIEDKIRRKELGRPLTAFDKKAVNAVSSADKRMELSDEILKKVRLNITDKTRWEEIGETYCCRNTFYHYCKKYRYFVAEAAGITDKERKSHG